MLKTIFLLILSICLYINKSSAQEIQKKIFNKNYYSSQIKKSMCGPNIKIFLEILNLKKIDIRDVDVIILRNKGYHYTGLVKAYQTRWGSLTKSPEEPSYSARLNGWHHHVFAVYKGLVFDFSFNTTPSVLSFKEYLEEMYIPKYTIPTFGPYQPYTPTKAFEALNGYKINVVNGIDYIKGSYDLSKLKEENLLDYRY